MDGENLIGNIKASLLPRWRRYVTFVRRLRNQNYKTKDTESSGLISKDFVRIFLLDFVGTIVLSLLLYIMSCSC